jgi:hypothetical protein
MEAEAEREWDRKSSSMLDAAEGLLGRSTARHMGEEVFLAQLHRRAFLLNDGFQNQILQILSRYETINRVKSERISRLKSKASWSESEMSGLATQFSADLIIGNSSRDLTRASSVSERSWRSADAAIFLFECTFADGVGAVEVHQAPIKTWVDV